MSSTENEYATLVYSMIQETRELELEIISLRYLLSTCMCGEHRQDLRDEIYTSTLPKFRDEPAYNQFVQEYLNGKDPFETRAYTSRMKKQAHGYIEDDRQRHPNLCLQGLSDYLKISGRHIKDLR